LKDPTSGYFGVYIRLSLTSFTHAVPITYHTAAVKYFFKLQIFATF